MIGTDARGQARQRLGSFVKLRPLVIDIGAALTTQGPTKVGGSAEIDGSDHVPVGWTGCPSAVPPLAGLRTPDSSVVSYTGSCSGGSCVHGVPQVNEDPTVGDSTFFEYGDLDWDALTAMANKPLPPGAYTGIDPLLTADGQCDVSKALNWGAPFDPLSPCHEYYPIIYVPGDMKINGNTGQGLLLVEGNLDVQGGFEFFTSTAASSPRTPTSTSRRCWVTRSSTSRAVPSRRPWQPVRPVLSFGHGVGCRCIERRRTRTV